MSEFALLDAITTNKTPQQARGRASFIFNVKIMKRSWPNGYFKKCLILDKMNREKLKKKKQRY